MSRSSEYEYDYVIAGGGTAGCALAARLAEGGDARVCVVEAGGSGRHLFIRMPAGIGFIFGNPKLDWGYESVPVAGLNGRRIYFPRGRGLGGSSNMNGMIYMRGAPADYDRWRDGGLAGWGFADLLPYFRRSEGALARGGPWHGTHGPLRVSPSVNYGELERAYVEAAAAAGHRVLDDLNGPERTGVARADSMVHKGVRQSSAIAYLRTRPANLSLMTGRHIARVLIHGNRAVGVETVDGARIRAGREVILCQGAFATPQTLMLSGIGPADHLSRHGIDTRVHLPGVGAHLADHVDVPIPYGSERMDLSLARHQRLDRAAWLMLRWLVSGTGPGAGAFFSAVLFHALRDPALPEFQVFMTPMVVDENLTSGERETAPLLQRLGRRLLVRGRKVARPGIQIDVNLERPHSTGSVRLASADPLDHPLIDPGFFSDERDMQDMVRGVEHMREVMARPPIAGYVTSELGAWRDAHGHAEVVRAIRETAYTGHHVCGSARMGADDDDGAVLDGRLRVRGVEGLRVCDASAMPSQITGNPNATIIAMAEKAADMILERPPAPPEDPRSLP